ncbi:MAG: hypothetical protein QG670_599 [Thermoproteota archaeon]|nr:hypothetical protein [Thermoproteota archaeon]
MDLMFKLEYLELMFLRHENNKRKWKQFERRFNRYTENVKSDSLSQKELQEENEITRETIYQYSRLLMLDIDSFFVFANILLDRIPFLLRPLYKGIVTNRYIAKRHFESFRKHLDWFEKSPSKPPIITPR